MDHAPTGTVGLEASTGGIRPLFSWLASLRATLTRSLDAILAVHGFPVLARLTLLYLLFKPLGDAWERFCLLTLAGCGLVVESASRRAWFWIGMLALTVAQMSWESDNHIYLFAYWLLTLGLASILPNGEQICALNARGLIAGAMGLSVLWKAVLSSDYMSGTFFHTTFFADARFKDFASLVGGMTDELWNYNRFLLSAVDGGALPSPVFLKSTPRLWALAVASTWWTVTIEALIAVLFLLPARWRWLKAREWALLAFVGSTYAVAPVPGFGWLLTILGLAQCEKERRAARLGLLASFVLILAYSTTSVTKALDEAVKPETEEKAPASTNSVPFASPKAGPPANSP